MDVLPKEFEHTLRANKRIALSSFNQFFDFARVTKSQGAREKRQLGTVNCSSHSVMLIVFDYIGWNHTVKIFNAVPARAKCFLSSRN